MRKQQIDQRIDLGDAKLQSHCMNQIINNSIAGNTGNNSFKQVSRFYFFPTS